MEAVFSGKMHRTRGDFAEKYGKCRKAALVGLSLLVTGLGTFNAVGGVRHPTDSPAVEVVRWIGAGSAACDTGWAAYKCIQLAKEYFSGSSRSL